MTLKTDLRWNRHLRALSKKNWVVRTRSGLGGGFAAGAVLGLCVGVWLAATATGEDDEVPFLGLVFIVAGLSTLICAAVGAAASFAGSRIEPLRLRVLTVVLAGMLAGMAANRLLGLGYDFFTSPVTCIPLIGGTIGSAFGMMVQE